MGTSTEWFGRRYPSLEDLEMAVEAHGCLITSAEIGGEALFIAGEGAEPPVVILPVGVSHLRLCWLLAHELGHLVQHAGPRGALLRGKDEAAADRWASRALIPQAAVRRHRNASLDAFIGALSKHYGDIPMEDCPDRHLAGWIAQIRLRCLEEVA